MALKLPIGIQDFSELRTGGFVYVDKTEIVHELVSGAKTYFLSRPRRFGKSLLISTFRYLFEGRQDLFKGLWIENNWNWAETSPIIRLSLDAIGHKEIGLESALMRSLGQIAEFYDIEVNEPKPSLYFQTLIQKLAAKQGRVVILIDEYDRPIIDFLGVDTPQAEVNRGILKSFFSILKSEDANIRFLFLTGISKFSKVSIFSDLNHLYDITLDPNCGTICGYTQAEIDHNFLPILAEMPDNTRSKMREWYNGYSWNGVNWVYNPFSVLCFLRSHNYDNFWFTSGMPTFLIKLLNKKLEYAVDNLEVEPMLVEAYELDNIDPIALLFQTGYLTIKEKTEYGTLILDYPNREVKEAFLRALVADYTHETRVIPRILQIHRSLLANDIQKTFELLHGLFKSIPNQIFIANREAYYHSIIYLTFTLLGIQTQAEVNASDGRLDALVHTPERLFIFEFKLNATAEAALQQIRDKDYAAPYRHLDKTIVGVGIQLSESDKGLAAWVSAVM